MMEGEKNFSKELKYALKLLMKDILPDKNLKALGQVLLVKLNLCQVHLKNLQQILMVIKKINLFEKSDALASGANYLKKVGWNNKIHWGEKINIKINKELQKFLKKKKYSKTLNIGKGMELFLKINTMKIN